MVGCQRVRWSWVLLNPEREGLRDLGDVLPRLARHPKAHVDFGGGEIFDFALEFLTILAADLHTHLLHGVVKVAAHIDLGRFVPPCVIVNVGRDNATFRAGGRVTHFESSGTVGLRQHPCPDMHAHIAAVGLPELPVLGIVAKRQKALHENRVDIGDVLRPDKLTLDKRFRLRRRLHLLGKRCFHAGQNIRRALHVVAAFTIHLLTGF